MFTTAKFRRIGGARAGVVALVALVVGGLLTIGVSAPASAAVAFTLKLTSKSGTALTGYEIFPIQVSNGSETTFDSPVPASPVSGQSGFYSMTLLDNTTYTLAMFPGGTALNSATLQYLGGTATLGGATTFNSSTSSFLAASIATGGTITGHVTSPSGSALKGADVESYFFDGTNWIAAAGTTTSTSGAYTLANAVPGSYKFRFYAPGAVYPTIYSGGATSLATAASSYLAAGATLTVNQKFSVGTGEISGVSYLSQPNDYPAKDYYDSTMNPIAYRVTSEHQIIDDSNHIANVADAVDFDDPIAGPASGAEGTWHVKNLPAGDYIIQVEPHFNGQTAAYVHASSASPGVGDGPYEDATPFSAATVFTVTAGHTTNAGNSEFVYNSAATTGAVPKISVQGQLADNSFVPIVGAQVTIAPQDDALDTYNGTETSASTFVTLYDSTGKAISITNSLMPGWYTVSIVDPSQTYQPVDKIIEWLGLGNDSFDFYEQALPPGFLPGFAEQPSIDGTATAVGTTYTASATANDSGATLSYQWLRNEKPIYGATSAAYTSVGSDLNTQLSVRITASLFGFAPGIDEEYVGGDSTPTTETIGDPLVNATAPAISPDGTATVGTTLTASVGTWTIDSNAASGLTYQYLWSNGATCSSYVVQQSDVGNPITVQVIALKNGFTPSDPADSSNTIPVTVHAAPSVTKAPVVTKTVKTSSTTYSVTTGSWDTTGLTYHYAWTIGTHPYGTDAPTISTATGGLPSLPATSPLTVTVTTSRTGYLTGNSGPIDAVKGTAALTQTTAPIVEDVTQATFPASTDDIDLGDTLTVSTPGVWTSPNGTPITGYTYQWYRGSAAISGATSATYTVAPADVSASANTEVSVEETASSSFYVSQGSALVGSGLAQPVAFPTPAPAVTFSGPVQDGHSVSAVVGSWGVTGVVDTYQWFDCPVGDLNCTDPTMKSDFDMIAGATKSSLAVTAAMGSVYVAVGGTAAGYIGSTTSSAIGTVDAALTIQLTGGPTITGKTGGYAHVGAKLTASPAPSSVTSTTVTYDWQTEDCSTDPCGAWTDVHTGSTYTPTGADFGNGDTNIQVIETATKTLYAQAQATSLAYPIAQGTIVDSKAPTAPLLSGGNYVAQLNGVYTPSGGTITFVWVVDGVPQSAVPGGTLEGQYPASDAVGDSLAVEITDTLPGYLPLHEEAIAQKGTTVTASTSAETITGTRYGTTLGLSIAQPFTDANATPDPRGLTYQWYSGSTAISGKTASTYTPSSSYVGKKISVKIAGPSTYYKNGTFTSSAITLAPGSFGAPAAPTVTFTGSLYPGIPATAAPDTADYVWGPSTSAAPVFVYKWQHEIAGAWTTISGATASTYMPTASDAGLSLRVEVTVTKNGYTTSALYSSGVAVGYPPAIAALTPPSLGSTERVGTAITVNTGSWNTPSLTYSYVWLRNGVVIPGATSSTWTPTADSVGDEIQAQVTASHSGYLPVTALTETETVQPGVAPTALVNPVITENVAAGTYTVSPGTWSIDGLTYTYEWQVAGADGMGTGGNTATYKPSLSDGGFLTVIVTVSRGGYSAATPLRIAWANELPGDNV